MTKVIVTGGCGFIGTYVVNVLVSEGYDVIVADNLAKSGNTPPQSAKLIRCDLRDIKQTEEAFKGAEICINMASLIGGIGYFHKYPATILSDNNRILSSTFEVAAKNKIRRMVYISSSMVYESSKLFPHKETDIAKIPPPLTGYGFSKLTGEYYCKTFKEEHGLDYTIIRPFNAYGINEYPGSYVGYSHVIPDLIKKIISEQYPLEILGNGNQSRCFTHVKDIASGIVMAMESQKAACEDFNLGTDKETRIIDLARMLWRQCERKQDFKYKSVEGFRHDIEKRVPDITKAKTILNWTPKISLEEGLKEVVNWLKYDKNK